MCECICVCDKSPPGFSIQGCQTSLLQRPPATKPAYSLRVYTHTSSNSNLHQLQYKPCFAHTSYLCVKEKHRDTKTYTDITCGDTHTYDNDESSVIQHFYLHVSVGGRELDSIVSAHKHRHTHTHTCIHTRSAVDELCGRWMGWNVAIKNSLGEQRKGKWAAWGEQKWLEWGC